MYSRELVVPVEGLEPSRYRRDLLELAPGRLPLCRDGIPLDLVELVSSDGGESYPVLLELPAVTVETPTAELTGGSWFAPAGAFPVSDVLAIHLRSDRELEEIRVRAFSNIDIGDLPLRVSPTLFEGEAVDAGSVVDWLTALPPVPHSGAEIFRRADAVAGAVCLIAAFGTENSLPITGLAQLVNDLVSSATADRGSPGWLERWLVRLAWPDDDRGALDVALLQPLIAALVNHDPLEDIVATEFLRSLRVAAGAGGGALASSVEKALARIADLVRGEAPFIPLRPEGSTVAKALLLFLLRPSVEAVATWTAEDIGASPQVHLLAFALSGLATGYRGLPVRLRGTVAFRRLISTALADRFNAETESPLPATLGRDPRVASKRVGQTISMIDVASGDVLMSRESDESEPVERLLSLESFEGPDREVGVLICEVLGWSDCLEWEIVSDTASVAPAGRRILITVPGSATLERVLTEGTFRERLRQTPREDVIAAITTNTPTTKKPAKKRAVSKPKPKSPEDERGQSLPGISPEGS